MGYYFFGGFRFVFFIVVLREEGLIIFFLVLYEYVVDVGFGFFFVCSSEDSELGCIFC